MISALRHKPKFNFDLFWKEKLIFGFPCCSTRKDLSIDVSITNVGLILTKPGWYLFSGYGEEDGQTDRVLESSHGNMSAHKKISTQSSKLGVSCRSLYASPDDGIHNKRSSKERERCVEHKTCAKQWKHRYRIHRVHLLLILVIT